MNHVLLYLLLAFDFVLSIYAWLALAAMILIWLKGFNVVTEKTHGVALIDKYLGLVTEPVLRPIRSVVPVLGGVDGSPFVLLLIVMFARYLMALYLIPRLA